MASTRARTCSFFCSRLARSLIRRVLTLPQGAILFLELVDRGNQFFEAPFDASQFGVDGGSCGGLAHANHYRARAAGNQFELVPVREPVRRRSGTIRAMSAPIPLSTTSRRYSTAGAPPSTPPRRTGVCAARSAPGASTCPRNGSRNCCPIRPRRGREGLLDGPLADAVRPEQSAVLAGTRHGIRTAAAARRGRARRARRGARRLGAGIPVRIRRGRPVSSVARCPPTSPKCCRISPRSRVQAPSASETAEVEEDALRRTGRIRARRRAAHLRRARRPARQPDDVDRTPLTP